MSTGNFRVTRGASKESLKRKKEAERKDRENDRFSTKKRINRNDLPVNVNLGKVKLEQDFIPKQEVDSDESMSSNEELYESVYAVEEIVDVPAVVLVEQDEIPDSSDNVETEDHPIEISGGFTEDNLILTSEPLTLHNQLEDPEQSFLQPDSSTVVDTEILSAQVLTFVLNYLRKKSVYKCRMVCEKWRCAVDTFMEENDYLYNLEEKFTFEDQGQIEKFLRYTTKFKRSPFMNRSATFLLKDTDYYKAINDTEEICDRYWQMVQDLLTKFGGGLISIEIGQIELDLTPLDLYKILESCLPHLPNLEVLSVSGNFKATGESEKEAEDLKKYIVLKRLPVLSKLRSFDVAFKEEVFAIKKAILEASPNLQELHVDWDAEGYDSLNHATQNLREIYLKRSLEKETEQFSKILIATKRFKTLTKLEISGFISLVKKKRLVLPKSLSLRVLSLLVCSGKRLEPYEIVENVLKTTGFYAKILSYFPNLKKLHIYEKCKDDSKALAEVTGCQLMYQSDIWDKFKTLDEIGLRYSWKSKPKASKCSVPLIRPMRYQTQEMRWTRKEYDKAHKIQGQ